MKLVTSLLAGFLFAGVALTGCSTPTSSGNEGSSGAPKTGGTLVIAELSDATKLDPHKGTDIPSANVYHGKIYEGLVKQDKNMEIQPSLATEWKKVNETTWEFKLRQGVKFHDGTPFNAAAVKKTIDRVLDKKTASSRKDLFEMITEVKIIDDYTIQLITSYPFAPLLANLAHYAGGIISPKAIDEQGDKLGQNPSGTGPFKFESWTPGQEIKLSKNNEYWGEKAKVEKVTFRVIPEDSTRIALVETGEAQLAEPVPVTDVERVSKSSSMTLVRSDALGVDYVGFNLKKKPFDDVRVRKAINLAVDTEAILSGVYNNVGSKATSPMGPKVWGFNPNLKGYPYDVNKAKELLKEAGYSNGFKTTIWTNDNKTRVKVAEVIQSQLKGIGINAEIKVLEWGAYLEATAKGEHDMYVLGWSNLTGDADYNQYFLFHTKAFGNVGNRHFYSNPEIDKLIDAGRRESDPAKRKEIYAKAQEIEMEDASMILLRNNQYLVASGKNVKGFWMHPSGIMMINEVSIQ
ncbi:glutathione ABC transporter substrate-binding protein [Paenibacillus sp. yr247]|uniref:glutathione ABC transporter substrate-binding protein n=1 Tax=Paenibacillus sp. yr247 TaxID=1761880 RepID=UPI000B8A3083|nr:glutathione ABC transporter substrate-binding protein [Paenibacillus sp. yr247]